MCCGRLQQQVDVTGELRQGVLRLLILLKVRHPVHVTLLRGHISTQLAQGSRSLNQHAWQAWGEAGEAATSRSRGQASINVKRSRRLVMGTGQPRQGMIHLLMLLKAWHPGHVTPSVCQLCEPQLGRWVRVQLCPKGLLHEQTA